MANGFVHLHVHTEFSLLDSLVRIPALMERVAEMGMPAVAITDSGNLYGAVRFYREARRRGLRPILGVELEVAPMVYSLRSEAESNPDLVLLAETPEGWNSLRELVSETHVAHPPPLRPVASVEMLARWTRGLIVLTGGNNGEIARWCRSGQLGAAETALRQLVELYGREQVFVELANQGLPGQAELRAALREVARRVGVACVATNNVHYLSPADAVAHQQLRSWRRGNVQSDTAYSDQFHLRSIQEMYAAFAEDPAAVARTVEIAERCQASPFAGDGILGPEIELPVEFEPEWPQAYREELYLRHRAVEALRHKEPRFQGGAAVYERRLASELEAVVRARAVRRVLWFCELVLAARRQGWSVGVARPSWTSSVLSWLLGLTDVDPVAEDLSSQSFINTERPEAPELALEVSPLHRGAFLRWLVERVGPTRVGHTVMFGVFGWRSALREMARANGLSPAETDALVRRIHVDEGLSTAATVAAVCRQLAELGRPEWGAILSAVTGLPRNPSAHPTAWVVSDLPLAAAVPVARTPEGFWITQWDVDTVVRMGLIRLDVVTHAGAGWLSAGPEAEVVSCEGEELPSTLAALGTGHVVGIPYVDTPALRERLRKERLRHWHELANWLALEAPENRDGFLTSSTSDRAPARTGGRRARWWGLLRDTGGRLLFAEQAQRWAEWIGGLSPSRSDLLRRAVANRDEELIGRLWRLFARGAAQRKLSADEARLYWEQILDALRRRGSRARFLAQARCACRAVRMREERPAAWVAMAMDAYESDSPVRWSLVREAWARGCPIRGPSLNRSGWITMPEGSAVRLGLLSVRGLHESAIEAWLREREQRGQFASVADFVQRVGLEHLSKTMALALLSSGALDELATSRSSAAEELESVLSGASSGRLWEIAPRSVWNEEREALGFPVSPHPLTQWAWILLPAGFFGWSFEDAVGRESVPMAGVVVERRSGAGRERIRLDWWGGEAWVEIGRELLSNWEPSTDAAVWLTAVPLHEGVWEARSPIHPLTELDRHVCGLSVEAADWMSVQEAGAALREALQGFAGDVPVCVTCAGSRDGRTRTGRVRVCPESVRALAKAFGWRFLRARLDVRSTDFKITK